MQIKNVAWLLHDELFVHLSSQLKVRRRETRNIYTVKCLGNTTYLTVNLLNAKNVKFFLSSEWQGWHNTYTYVGS